MKWYPYMLMFILCKTHWILLFNKSKSTHNGRQFVDDILKIILYESCSWIHISQQLDKTPTLVRKGDNPFSEPVMAYFSHAYMSHSALHIHNSTRTNQHFIVKAQPPFPILNLRGCNDIHVFIYYEKHKSKFHNKIILTVADDNQTKFSSKYCCTLSVNPITILDIEKEHF